MPKIEDIDMIDLLDVDTVEVFVDDTNKLWVNVDGKCLLRIGKIKVITLDDPLRGQDVIVPKTDRLPVRAKL